jgi:hypothetical protein
MLVNVKVGVKVKVAAEGEKRIPHCQGLRKVGDDGVLFIYKRCRAIAKYQTKEGIFACKPHLKYIEACRMRTVPMEEVYESYDPNQER